MLSKLEREYIFSLKTSLVFGIINDVFNIPSMLVIMIAPQLEKKKKTPTWTTYVPVISNKYPTPFILTPAAPCLSMCMFFFSFLGVAAPFSCWHSCSLLFYKLFYYIKPNFPAGLCQVYGQVGTLDCGLCTSQLALLPVTYLPGFTNCSHISH